MMLRHIVLSFAKFTVAAVVGAGMQSYLASNLQLRPFGGFAAAAPLYDPCPAYTDSLVGCLLYDTNDTFDACRDCVLDSVRQRIVRQSSLAAHGFASTPSAPSADTQRADRGGVETCHDLESILCSALASCPCPSCRQEYADSLLCVLETHLQQRADSGDATAAAGDPCRFECPDLGGYGGGSSASPAGAREEDQEDPRRGCNVHKVRAARCYAESRTPLREAVACHTCIVHAMSAPASADRGPRLVPLECDDDHQDRLLACDAISTCPCDPCQAEELSYWDCLFQVAGNCTLRASCGAVSSHPAAAARVVPASPSLQ
jgi:hypothetical protein